MRRPPPQVVAQPGETRVVRRQQVRVRSRDGDAAVPEVTVDVVREARAERQREQAEEGGYRQDAGDRDPAVRSRRGAQAAQPPPQRGECEQENEKKEDAGHWSARRGSQTCAVEREEPGKAG